MKKNFSQNKNKKKIIKKKTKREVKTERDSELFKLYHEMILELKACGSEKCIDFAVRFGLIKVRRK